MLGARPLPPRPDPRAGRPPRPSKAGTARSGPRVRRASARNSARPDSRGREHDSHADAPAHGFGRALGLTVVGALLPGSGFVAAGYKRIGWTLLAGLAVLIGLAAWLGTSGKHVGIRLAVSP